MVYVSLRYDRATKEISIVNETGITLEIIPTSIGTAEIARRVRFWNQKVVPARPTQAETRKARAQREREEAGQ